MRLFSNAFVFDCSPMRYFQCNCSPMWFYCSCSPMRLFSMRLLSNANVVQCDHFQCDCPQFDFFNLLVLNSIVFQWDYLQWVCFKCDCSPRGNCKEWGMGQVLRNKSMPWLLLYADDMWCFKFLRASCFYSFHLGHFSSHIIRYFVLMQ